MPRRFLLLLPLLLLGAGSARQAGAQVADSTQNQRFRLAESYIRAGQYEHAITLLTDLYRARPDAYVFYDRLKRSYESLKRYREAIALVDEQIARNRVPIHVAEKARLLHLSGSEEEARRTFEEAIAMNPRDAATYVVVYQAMLQLRLIQRAIETLERGREAIGTSARFEADLAGLYSMNGQHTRAAEEYVALLKRDANQLAFVRARLNRIADDPAALREVVSLMAREVRRDPTVRPLRELLAWLYLESGSYMEALNAFRALDRLGDQDGRALFNFAQQAADAGAFEAAAEAYTELLSRYPDAVVVPDAQYGLGSMYQAWGARAGAMPEGASSGASRYYARAMDAYRTYLRRHPRHGLAPNARYQMAWIQWHVDRVLPDAEQTLRELVREHPNHPIAAEASLDLGVLAMEDGRLGEARSAFSRIVDQGGRSEVVERARYELALSHLYTGDVATALTVASAVNRNTSMDIANDAIELRLLLQENKGPDSLNSVLREYGHALYLERTRETDRALAAVDALLRQNANHPIADDARFKRGQLLESLGDFAAAVAAFAEFPMLHPRSPLADRALFRAAEIHASRLGDDDQALKLYNRLLAEYPGSILASETRLRIRRLRGDGV